VSLSDAPHSLLLRSDATQEMATPAEPRKNPAEADDDNKKDETGSDDSSSDS